jgi:DNA-binding CsgD family transcriptional regulator
MEQRWLNIHGICAVLGMSENMIRTLVRKRQLVKITTKQVSRFLDPTPEYQEQLRLGQNFFIREHEAELRFSAANILTQAEIARVLNINFRTVSDYMIDNKIPGHTITHGAKRYKVYSVETVRNMIWKRNRRGKGARGAGPFLLKDIIEFFLRYQATEDKFMPTDEQFDTDDFMRRKIARMMHMKSPQRELAFNAFIADVELAKGFVALLRSQTTVRTAASALLEDALCPPPSARP